MSRNKSVFAMYKVLLSLHLVRKCGHASKLGLKSFPSLRPSIQVDSGNVTEEHKPVGLHRVRCAIFDCRSFSNWQRLKQC